MGLVHRNFRVAGELTGETTDKPLLPFGARTAQRLMGISKQPLLTNPTHASDLPPSWMTLYELTKLPDLDANVRRKTLPPNALVAPKIFDTGFVHAVYTGRLQLVPQKRHLAQMPIPPRWGRRPGGIHLESRPPTRSPLIAGGDPLSTGSAGGRAPRAPGQGRDDHRHRRLQLRIGRLNDHLVRAAHRARQIP